MALKYFLNRVQNVLIIKENIDNETTLKCRTSEAPEWLSRLSICL